MTFRIGQKVVCVDASPCISVVPTPLIERKVYTIDGFNLDGSCVVLSEIGLEPCEFLTGYFFTRRFRPVVEKKTDISVFTAMLNQKQREHSLCGND